LLRRRRGAAEKFRDQGRKDLINRKIREKPPDGAVFRARRVFWRLFPPAAVQRLAKIRHPAKYAETKT
jgi:hypothetical protein